MIGLALTTSTATPLAIAEHYPALRVPISLLVMLGYVSLYSFFYLFPDGRFSPRWAIWLVPLVIVHEWAAAFRPDLLGNDPYLLALILSAILAQLYRFWRSSNFIQRQETKWVVFGSVIAGAGNIGMITFFPVVVPINPVRVAGLLLDNTA